MTRNQEISRPSFAVTAKMYHKSVVHVQRCCCGCEAYCFFDVLVAVAVVVAKLPLKNYTTVRQNLTTSLIFNNSEEQGWRSG